MRKSPLLALLSAGLAATLAFPAHAEKKEQFDVCWTIYAGWMPWEYGATQGIVDKWAQKYGIEIKVTQLNDYVESINQYTAGQFDGCTMTNMDALTIPAAGGVDDGGAVGRVGVGVGVGVGRGVEEGPEPALAGDVVAPDVLVVG